MLNFQFIIKTTQENLNNCLKQNLLLKHEVETERLKKSMIKMELETLTTMLRKCNYKNNSELNVKVLMHEREHLTNKIYQLKIENIELKQALTKSNNQIQSLTEKQHECTEKINLVTPILNSLQLQINKQKKDSDTLINLLCVSKNLARKILSALEYTRKSNKIQSDHIQNLIKEVASIKSNLNTYNYNIQTLFEHVTNLYNQWLASICSGIVSVILICWLGGTIKKKKKSIFMFIIV
ncbi:Hypothetical protein CINCED_3A012253 [Cinara cedri]|uniref:Uncharacterized protein n=1 Tax=Cinara cedri TaxID=506608 RepID=A0A5E4NF77_9HEMI|nr:Hypothetical protein CINCED_3A012253 [Cinara cedri]